ncbi:hypothetical protein, partial [Paenibacillus sp.]
GGMMKQCLIITAYKSVAMLRQLLRDTCSYCKCFVHVDNKAWNDFSELSKELPEVVFLSKYSVN